MTVTALRNQQVYTNRVITTEGGSGYRITDVREFKHKQFSTRICFFCDLWICALHILQTSTSSHPLLVHQVVPNLIVVVTSVYLLPVSD